jgi:hypothetical protein
LSNKDIRKINICLQTLEVGTHDRSAQEPENWQKNKVHTKFLTEILVLPFEDTTILDMKRLTG